MIGGAASGKSVWAEGFVEKHEKSMIYLATGEVYDAEVAARVKIHKNRRDARWTTREAPLDVASVLSELTADHVVLIDCATMWLTNHMMAGNDLDHAKETLLEGLRTCVAPWVIVSNEVGQGIVPDNAMARQFREAQGRLNIALAAEADLAVQIVAGLPVTLKGTLP